jgi:hypothetical protein
LFLSLATAVSLHYFALFAFAAIGFGELVHAWRRRRMDWPVWGALVFATTPLLFFLPLIRVNTIFVQGGYEPATLSHFIEETILFYLPGRGVLWLAFVLVAGVCILVFGRREVQPPATFEVPPVHELAAWTALLLAPVEVFIAGRLITGVFSSRYAIVTVIGFSTLLPLCLQRLFRGSRAAALAELLVLILCFGLWYPHSYQRSVLDLNASLTLWMRTSKTSQLPIVVADPIMYLLLAHGAAKDLRDVVVYMPDGSEASRYGRLGTADYTLAGLRGLAPLNMPTFADFTSVHQRFLVLWDNSPSDWIVPKLLDTGVELRLCKTLGPRVLFFADLSDRARPIADRRLNFGADMAWIALMSD